jgi:hypothetical protein
LGGTFLLVLFVVAAPILLSNGHMAARNLLVPLFFVYGTLGLVLWSSVGGRLAPIRRGLVRASLAAVFLLFAVCFYFQFALLLRIKWEDHRWVQEAQRAIAQHPDAPPEAVIAPYPYVSRLVGFGDSGRSLTSAHWGLGGVSKGRIFPDVPNLRHVGASEQNGNFPGPNMYRDFSKPMVVTGTGFYWNAHLVGVRIMQLEDEWIRPFGRTWSFAAPDYLLRIPVDQEQIGRKTSFFKRGEDLVVELDRERPLFWTIPTPTDVLRMTLHTSVQGSAPEVVILGEDGRRLATKSLPKGEGGKASIEVMLPSAERLKVGLVGERAIVAIQGGVVEVERVSNVPDGADAP